MSIVDAISKAKKIAQQSRPTEAIGRSAAREALSPHPETTSPAAPVQPVQLKPIAATMVDPDVSLIRNNRLLLAGSEELLDKKVESAYRMLRTRLLHRARAQGWVTIGVTSACPDDGKTLTALNLALSLAREKNNDIVLVDLDMRNPSVFKCLGIAPPNHIREYFEGSVEADDLFVSIGVDNLLLAGGAQVSEKSSELLSNSRFGDLVSFIKERVARPLIVLDLPPVLSTDDALVVAPKIDALLIVTSEGKTSREELRRAVDTLSEYRIAGFVLNRSQDAVKGYGYY